MTRDEAMTTAWQKLQAPTPPDRISIPYPWWKDAFNAGWDARPCPTLLPVIEWLERGGDPKHAADELRIYQLLRDGA